MIQNKRELGFVLVLKKAPDLAQETRKKNNVGLGEGGLSNAYGKVHCKHICSPPKRADSWVG